MSDNSNQILNVIAFGGGTGMPNLLRGLKSRNVDLTAVVVVSDDGGSSGELRSLYDMPAPGDLRNVIASLGEADSDFLDLLQFRFADNLLKDHSLGNLVLAALTKIKGGFPAAVDTLSRLAQVRGKVIPAAFERVALVATHSDGSKSTGEVSVSGSAKPIVELSLKPAPAPAGQEILEAIDRADAIVFGPGSLFTSVVPHLLTPGVAEAVSASSARVIYVANIMTQPGETTDFTLTNHVDALRRHGLEKIDMVICHEGDVTDELMSTYADAGAAPVPPEELDGIQVTCADLADLGARVRHDPDRLADVLLSHVVATRDDSSSPQVAEGRATIVNENGLHTRPASQIVKLANEHNSHIVISLRGQKADASSIMELILLTATHGSELEIRAEGADAPVAVEALKSLIAGKFAEEA